MVSDWNYFSGGKYIKNSSNSCSCSPVNSCIIGCKDIFGQLCQTNLYIANFQGVETLKITLKLPHTP